MFFSTFHHQEIPRRNCICSVTACQFIYSILSSFFGWCRAQVCRSGSKDICTLQNGFLCLLLFLYLYFHSLPCIITHLCFFLFPRRVPSDLEVGYEKSILTRTETLFYHYLFQRTPVIYNCNSEENVFLFAIYFHQNMKLGPDKFFCLVTPRNCVCDNIN